MAYSVSLSGYPEVAGVDVFQGSLAAPGRIVVDTLIAGSAELTAVPLATTLTITNTNGTFAWSGLRVAKRSRQFGAFMRTVFEDSRWVLRETVIPRSFNVRDCNGVLFPETSRTITELVGILATATGLSISVGTIPSYQPLADWRGKTAEQAMDQLLARTGCRLVYRPATGAYVFTSAASGSLSGFASVRAHRAVPVMPIRNVTVFSAPITYEGVIDCTAVVRNGSNVLETVASPNGIFENFESMGSGIAKQRYQQAALRLWKPDSPGDTILLGRRALTIESGDEEPMYAGAHFIDGTDGAFGADSLSAVPMYAPAVQPAGGLLSGQNPNPISLTGGGAVFQCEHPHVQVDENGDVRTDAKIVCAYHAFTSAGFVRESSSVEISEEGTDIGYGHEWIKPVVSTLAGITSTAWTTLLGQVATAVAARHAIAADHASISSIVDHGGVGVVGGVRYIVKLGPQAEAKTSLAVAFDPTDARIL